MKKIWIIVGLLTCSMTLVHGNTKETVQLAKCVDGDTTHFQRNEEVIKVRYLAINAPEYTKTKEPYGKQASAYVCDVLQQAKTIELEYDDGSDKLDKYGRTLAWVYVDRRLLQKELVEQGLAEVKYIYGDYAYTDELKKAEKKAKAAKLNMWSNAVPEEDDTLAMIAGGAGGILLILFGIFFAKGTRNKKKFLNQGVRIIKKNIRK